MSSDRKFGLKNLATLAASVAFCGLTACAGPGARSYSQGQQFDAVEPPPPVHYEKERHYAPPVDRDERYVAQQYDDYDDRRNYGPAREEICTTLRINLSGITRVPVPCPPDVPLFGPGGVIPVHGGISIGTQSYRRGVETSYTHGHNWSDGKVYHPPYTDKMGIPKKSGSMHYDYNY